MPSDGLPRAAAVTTSCNASGRGCASATVAPKIANKKAKRTATATASAVPAPGEGKPAEWRGSAAAACPFSRSRVPKPDARPRRRAPAAVSSPPNGCQPRGDDQRSPHHAPPRLPRSLGMTLAPLAFGAPSADEILERFVAHVSATGLALYPAQEEAILELCAGKHVILNTPTGSGKSLVATAMHFKALAENKVSYYTCPIKALVNEKFFALCEDFGAENVGMLTGDAAINATAPIICCTAEILA